MKIYEESIVHNKNEINELLDTIKRCKIVIPYSLRNEAEALLHEIDKAYPTKHNNYNKELEKLLDLKASTTLITLLTYVKPELMH